MFFEFGFGNVSINEIKKAMQRKNYRSKCGMEKGNSS